MLHFTFGTATGFHLTLSELATIEGANYLFVFTRRVPGQQIAIVLTPDASSERSDEFALDVDEVFAGCAPGQYTYEVYEQVSDSNTDPAQAGEVLEQGVMHLHPETPFSFTAYEPPTSFQSA